MASLPRQRRVFRFFELPELFAQFDRVYGSLYLVIALLLWAYISALVLIIGAEFGAAIGRWRRGETQRIIQARALGRG